MIESPTIRKGEVTRQRCIAGVRGLLASISRRLVVLEREEATRTIVIEIISACGVLSAVETTIKSAVAHSVVTCPREVLGEIFDRLDSLALPDVNKIIKIEIVSIKGALSAVEIESVKYRWDI